MNTPSALQLSIWRSFASQFPEAAKEINLSAREDIADRAKYMSVHRSKAEVEAWRGSGAATARDRIIGTYVYQGRVHVAELPEGAWERWAAPWTRRARRRAAEHI